MELYYLENLKITNTFVVYDGGIKFDKTVHSLFRYYNNAHDINL